MDIQTLLFKLGIGTWVEDITTLLPAVASPTVQIGNTLPTNVGFIYGLSTYADSVDPDGNTLITSAQAMTIYLVLKDGPTEFIQYIRMDDLLNIVAGSPLVRNQKFTSVNIPAFDLSKSYYKNPSSVLNATIRLKLWYIQANDWKQIKQHFTFDSQRPDVHKK